MLTTASVISLLSLVALVTLTESHRWKRALIPEFLKFGRCAKFADNLVEDFQSEKYQGLWFDIESVPNDYVHVKKCVTQTYTWTGEQMNVETRGLTKDDQKLRQTASMAIERKNEPVNNTAHMTVTADGVPAAPYLIIDTDYHNYACVYSCLSYALFKAEFSWIFGRGPVLAQEFIDKCHNKLKELSVDPTAMKKIFQADPDVCPYWGNLPKILEQSKTQLSKSLGPDSLANGSSPSRSIDEMLTIVSKSGSSETAVQEVVKQDMAPKVYTAPKLAAKPDRDSHTDHLDDQEESRASHMVSSTYLLTLIVTVLLAILMH